MYTRVIKNIRLQLPIRLCCKNISHLKFLIIVYWLSRRRYISRKLHISRIAAKITVFFISLQSKRYKARIEDIRADISAELIKKQLNSYFMYIKTSLFSRV